MQDLLAAVEEVEVAVEEVVMTSLASPAHQRHTISAPDTIYSQTETSEGLKDIENHIWFYSKKSKYNDQATINTQAFTTS